MIFCSRNEDGVLAAEQVLGDIKVVTRRMRPEPVGAIRAVCPGRGKKQLCKIEILSCQSASDWMAETLVTSKTTAELEARLDGEARLEGFKSWQGLNAWFVGKYGLGMSQIEPQHRIQFKRVKQ
jgi:hypothetical protein